MNEQENEVNKTIIEQTTQLVKKVTDLIDDNWIEDCPNEVLELQEACKYFASLNLFDITQYLLKK